MFFILRQNDDGGMPHLCLNVDELIDTGDRLDAKHGTAILCGTRLRLSKTEKQRDGRRNPRASSPPCKRPMSHSH